MGPFMIWYQYTDNEGLHLDTVFAHTYAQARNIIADLLFELHARVQLYQWDSEHEYYIFLSEEW